MGIKQQLKTTAFLEIAFFGSCMLISTGLVQRENDDSMGIKEKCLFFHWFNRIFKLG